MRPGQVVRQARRRAGLTQQALGKRAGVPQSVIARIESGKSIPRFDTMDRLLRGCGETLEPARALGIGIDRSQIRELLSLTPGQRARLAAADARALARLEVQAQQTRRRRAAR